MKNILNFENNFSQIVTDSFTDVNTSSKDIYFTQLQYIGSSICNL